MIRKLISRDDPLLRRKCENVINISSVRSIIEDLKDTIRFLKTKHTFARGIGLAAPQIGYDVAISVVEFNDKEHVLINPRLC